MIGSSLSGCFMWESLFVIGCCKFCFFRWVHWLWFRFWFAYESYKGISITSVQWPSCLITLTIDVSKIFISRPALCHEFQFCNNWLQALIIGHPIDTNRQHISKKEIIIYLFLYSNLLYSIFSVFINSTIIHTTTQAWLYLHFQYQISCAVFKFYGCNPLISLESFIPFRKAASLIQVHISYSANVYPKQMTSL